MNRPSEIGSWLKNGRKKYSLTPKITGVYKYKKAWYSWWRGLQPAWRLLKSGALSQEVPDTGEEWDSLRRGGPNGFFMIIMAFSWWVEAMGGVDDEELCDTLDDIIWVLQSMADMPEQLIGEKHALENEPKNSRSKRYVFSFPITLQTDGAHVPGGGFKEGVEATLGLERPQATRLATVSVFVIYHSSCFIDHLSSSDLNVLNLRRDCKRTEDRPVLAATPPTSLYLTPPFPFDLWITGPRPSSTSRRTRH